ncbi:hypothetical protein KUTeg_016473 [Tegillarca granosa]|uniref:Fe2OG dioxygenase domain-containing protein n=1 Tax=Tegillarca granosa TaxID=220873 RepID=A0ABQ9EKY4_TEGGR|nr:hypothetical protein KUTeg_016473 [Tegillarca granosa]
MSTWFHFHFRLSILVKILIFLRLSKNSLILATDTNDICLTSNGVVTCQKESSVNLTRIDGKKENHIDQVTLADGRHINLHTVSVKPLIIEIQDFLTKEECEYFIQLAKDEGLENSQTYHNKNRKGQVELYDTNRDKKLSVEEMSLTIQGAFDTYLDNSDILQMYKDENIDKNNDEILTPDELKNFSPSKLEKYIKKLLKKHPEKHSRYSQQVWLYPDSSKDPVFKTLQERVSTIVNLPIELIRMSDFQVVTYDIKGHYNAHFDSAMKDKSHRCCTRNIKTKCQGGETAFPVANNDTVDTYEVQNKNLVNLYKNCKDVSLKISPKQGKAIIWYNHFVDTEDGWMGDMDNYTLHGGCPVIRGRKWIANFWIKTTDNKSEDLEKMKRLHKPDILSD